ncbi:NADPH--hemoprotein reductase [Ascoidea rubescens DSM 1968]|uniref:NADPH--cytochrome P450 reductase n=1 Tax=Ascoidea rubescens DSM 1968 TaxID=1344418 RepID=A0A1D2VR49_9ASCO|nr:putative NADPH-dependent cytochrome P450 reductase [Ascoidea rubescens DSM 1968]ODV64086.1 putative NADPH-dependent cytochrome P450 reductase [Ascoidea rubescens DSM 1968]
MALDTIDIGVLVAIGIISLTYFTKGKLWSKGTLADPFSSENTNLINSNGSDGSDLVEKLKSSNHKAVVIYGSQTGTAEDYASKFAKEFQSKFKISTLLVDIEDYELNNLNEIPRDVLIFFFMATYGEGEFTDSAAEFGEYLESELSETFDDDDGDESEKLLSNLNYSVFGLGNSTYEFYNEVGNKVNKILSKNGAKLVAPYGQGDDGQGSMDEDYLAWKENCFESLKNSLSLVEHDSTYQPSVSIIPTSGDFDISKVFLGEPDKFYLNENEDSDSLSLGPFDHTHPYLAPVSFSKQLFSKDSNRHCVHAEFDLSKSNLRYSTGDHLALWPSNPDQEVLNFYKAFDLSKEKLEKPFDIKPLDSTTIISFPTPTTMEALVRYHLEITGSVSRQFLKSISIFAPNEESRSKANLLSSNKEEFSNEITSNKLNISDTLLKISNNVAWTKVPFEFLIESIQHIQPRYYSISSSSLSEKKIAHITAVVEEETTAVKNVVGVATNLLLNVEVNQNKLKNEDSLVKPLVTYDLNGPRNKFQDFKLPIHIRRSTFKLPVKPGTPIILVGPGTGVAPMRGFVRERVQQFKNGVKVGKILLFYGCRNSNEDFLYKEEWAEYKNVLGDLFEMVTAFSREDANKKVYVQNRMEEYSSKINEYISEAGYIYVCGDASRMARDVQNTFIKIIIKERKFNEVIATEMIRNFKTNNKYQEDVW